MHYRSQLDVDYKQSLSRKSPKRSPKILALASIIALALMGIVIANGNSLSEKPSQDLAVKTEIAPQAKITETIALSLSPVKSTNNTLENLEPADSEIKQATTQSIAKQTLDTPDEIPASLLNKPSEPTFKTETVEIKSGDTLSSIFSARNLNTELHKIMQLGNKVKELKRIHPKQKLHFHIEDQTLVAFELETSINRKLKIVKKETDYIVDEVIRDFETRVQIASSTIENSLFLAGQRAGLSDPLIMELANIFGWDIDFALDIRTGDQFSVVYEEKYLDGEKIKDGNIIAAEFINAGKQFRAARYTDSNGNTDYYSQQGRSMRKPFLRTPVDFARISSGFNLRRKHPILNKIRAHKGVDYAASTGTPIKASGDGKVVHRGTKGGYGKTIVIKHGSRYSTLYAHMHKYARSTQVGKRVKQGQIIGYVGKSGLATGPHLHYEFRVNGVHRNPLTVKLPDARPLPEKELVRFKFATAEQFAQLDTYSSTMLAENKSQTDTH